MSHRLQYYATIFLMVWSLLSSSLCSPFLFFVVSSLSPVVSVGHGNIPNTGDCPRSPPSTPSLLRRCFIGEIVWVRITTPPSTTPSLCMIVGHNHFISTRGVKTSLSSSKFWGLVHIESENVWSSSHTIKPQVQLGRVKIASVEPISSDPLTPLLGLYNRRSQSMSYRSPYRTKTVSGTQSLLGLIREHNVISELLSGAPIVVYEVILESNGLGFSLWQTYRPSLKSDSLIDTPCLLLETLFTYTTDYPQRTLLTSLIVILSEMPLSVTGSDSSTSSLLGQHRIDLDSIDLSSWLELDSGLDFKLVSEIYLDSPIRLIGILVGIPLDYLFVTKVVVVTYDLCRILTLSFMECDLMGSASHVPKRLHYVGMDLLELCPYLSMWTIREIQILDRWLDKLAISQSWLVRPIEWFRVDYDLGISLTSLSIDHSSIRESMYGSHLRRSTPFPDSGHS